MNDPLKALLDAGMLKTSSFPAASRYHDIPVGVTTGPDGREVAFLRRRFVPSPDAFSTLAEHTVTEGERPDQIAARYLNDPEQFWRLCDAGGVMKPDTLTARPGMRVRIGLPAELTPPDDI